jgi:hypothetical protein
LIKRRAEIITAGLQRRVVEKSFCKNGRIWIFFVAVVFLLAGLGPSLAGAEAENARIERVKAAFVLNIARFVTWPKKALEHQGDQLMLCLYRRNPWDEAIKTIEEKMVNGRLLRINLINSLAQSHSCSILLIGLDEIRHFDEESRQAANRPLLTIADLTDTDHPPTHQHALVTLVRNGAHIGFEINLAKARQAGLQMSSNLLKLAKIVGDGT